MSGCLEKARDDLRAAIDRRVERQRRVATADQAKGRAEDLVRDYRAKLTRLDAEARQAVERQASAIRSGEAPVLVPAPQSRELAQAEFNQATAALDILCREYTEAQRALLASDVAVREAVVRLVTLEAEILADQVIEYRQRAAELRDLLLGLTYVSQHITNDFRPWPMTSKLNKALNWEEPQTPGHINPVKDGALRWVNYRGALASDPNAQFEMAGRLPKTTAPMIKSVA